jgi:hypothetical protein
LMRLPFLRMRSLHLGQVPMPLSSNAALYMSQEAT